MEHSVNDGREGTSSKNCCETLGLHAQWTTAQTLDARSQIGSRSVVLTSAYERTATKAAAIARDRDGLGDGEPEPVGAGLEEKTPIDPFIFMDELIDCATSY